MKFQILIAILFSQNLFAQINDPSQFRIVPDDQVIEVLTPTRSENLSSRLNILVWNVKKAEQKEAWLRDLKNLTQNSQLVLLQEGMQDSYMPTALESIREMGWIMAKSFYMKIDQDATGVITGSTSQALNSWFLRSRDLEPLIKTPKISLLTSYPLSSGEKILVINIHGINFQTPEPFFRQIDDIISFAKTWTGPIFFAGDFNTWIQSRLSYLVKQTESIGMKQVKFPNDTRPAHKKLDHAFVRGCEVLSSNLNFTVTTSDHPPLEIQLDCL